MKRIVSRLILLTSVLALALSAMAQQQENHTTNNNPLALLLQSKGILSPSEVAMVNQASSPEEANARLAQLLVEKGLINQQEYKATVAPVSMDSSGPRLVNAVLHTSNAAQASSAAPATKSAPSGPPIIPAVAPLRVLPIDVPKQDGMIPDIKLGSGAKLKVYGFYKASAVSDTASSGGATFGSQDWPLPLLLGNTGPTSDPQVHLKARQFRIGAQTEWVPKGSDFTITGKIEGDFEGDYTDVNNRNISGSARSQFSLRQAWVRIDHKIGDLPWFAEFGEDWSLLGSSTLPSLFETTGLGVGMGSLYERMPMFKTGVQFHSGDFKVQPEFAIVMPTAGSSALTTDQRLRFGDRAGAESNQPGLEARVVFQFPLNHSWKGVAPAQIIFSGHHARMNEIIQHVNQVATSYVCITTPCVVPTPQTNLNTPNIGFSNTYVFGSTCADPLPGCLLSSFFPTGVQAGNPQNIWTAEVQLPTPWVTLAAKFYRGNDLRFFFGGQLNDVWSNLNGMGEVGNGVSFSGRPILAGCEGATPDPNSGKALDAYKTVFDCPTGNAVQMANLQPVGGSGGFAELSFPLSRIFNANPEGPNSGWVLHVSYGTDRAKYSDAQKGNFLGRTDLDTASLTYRLNKWVTFVHEVSYITTFTANAQSASGVITPHFIVFAGKDVRQAHDWRNEFGPVFTF
ncbi:MAG: hypothetical protein ACHP9V_06480 [Terriglobales bacterium]